MFQKLNLIIKIYYFIKKIKRPISHVLLNILINFYLYHFSVNLIFSQSILTFSQKNSTFFEAISKFSINFNIFSSCFNFFPVIFKISQYCLNLAFKFSKKLIKDLIRQNNRKISI